MNKVELIEALAPRLGGRQLAAMAVEALVDAVLREVAAGGTVGITGFGTFEKVDRAPRTGRNPHTGAPVPIAATSSPRFRPGAYFKEVVADPDRLPTDGLAGVRVGSHGEMADPEPASRPSSVRRTAAQGRPDEGRQGSRRTVNPGTDDADRGPKVPRRRRAASGTPATVRARQDEDRRPTGDASAGAADAAKASAPARDRTPAGGQDITMGMITAKKAELARVKNDDVVAVDEASGKKAQGKGKDKDRRTKDKPGKGSGKGKGRDGKGKGKDGKGKDGKKGKAGSRKKASKGS